MIKFFFCVLFTLSLQFSYAQQDTLSVEEKESLMLEELKNTEDEGFGINLYDPLAPSKAAFYSAVVPGLGQVYNRSYWKVPLVYAAIGTTAYFFIDNNKQYNRYRDAYKQRLTGQIDEFDGVLSNQNLIDAQKQFRSNRDLSLLLVFGAYVLNIVDANVDAHLQQFNVTENLSLKPEAQQNFLTGGLNFGLSLNFKL
ncbi:DUF5683 domain-containing protein [Psychroflexus maritimus]|uniref:DUF5683 domain-containing protein n=1 Tax=Psychroflexus maritimus TaxID=2714865 RepID=A0A967AJ70_9FLAO|nr:DUF5683 domain-containing protein [Psychroflexus maritimus]NGZ90300.1 hypothetical protein [Psychroflexus maritimus]